MATVVKRAPKKAKYVHVPMHGERRVRPPPIPKGTKAANTDPQPPGKVNWNAQWVQGAYRAGNSNATKRAQLIKGAQVERALKTETRGQNIFAYKNIRTNQVVYSLSRLLDVCQTTKTPASLT